MVALLCSGPAYATETRSYDLVVVGAGTGGCAAAIQAGRSGLAVALVEASDFLGGQMSGAAVSTMDDVGRTRTGLYGEFISRVRAYYDARGTATNICLWGGDTIATEPRIASEILEDMLRTAGSVDIYRFAEVEEVTMAGTAVAGLVVAVRDSQREKTVRLRTSLLIDATERGDLLPLAGARYRVGNSIAPQVDLEANVQDITYVAVVRKYPGGLPDDLRLPGPPPGYEKYVEKFRSIVTVDGDTWPGSYPFDIPSHNAYRALPDVTNGHRIVGDEADTWQFITRTCINWANDYPGRPGDRPGLSVRYIEDPEFRKKAEREAMHKTLCFLWYMQDELGMTDWSVDAGQGYGAYFSNDWETAADPLLPPVFAPILRHFPPFPYVREGRRIVGLETLADADISRDVTRGRAWKNDSSGLALGEYPVDIHGSHLDRYMEHDLGETTESFPKTWVGSQGVFQVPYAALIPEAVDGLIAAEKNISVSRMVNGAIRLHPITMHTGQAAGAIAAEAVRAGVRPREVDVLAVQRSLMAAGCWIALDRGIDVGPGSPYWDGVQWASLSEALGNISRQQFGVSLPIRRREAVRILREAAPALAFDGMDGNGDPYLTKREFLEAVGRAAGVDPWALADHTDADLTLKRGDAVAIAFHLLFILRAM